MADFHETPNMYPNLSNQEHFKLKEINEIKNYFVAEIKEREIMSKRLSISFATVTGAPVGIASASFSLAFSISTGITKKLLKTTKIKKKHNEIIMLARSKLNSTESKISEALIMK